MTDIKRIPCEICGKLSLKTLIDANKGMCISCIKVYEDAELKKEMKSYQSLPVFSTPGFLLSSKNKDYRISVLNRARAVAEVFTEEGFVVENLVARYDKKPEYFYIEYSELSATGRAFVHGWLQKWFQNTDRWKGDYPPSVEKYKQSLQLQCKRFKVEQP